MLVDMTVLYLLVDAQTLAWHPVLGKICAAEVAMLNNFLWNERWTFRSAEKTTAAGVRRRFIYFHAICGIGIGLAVGFLCFFHSVAGINLYVANMLAIGLVTLWNFWLNALFNWKV